jgi:prolyl 4-hydroxylase
VKKNGQRLATMFVYLNDLPPDEDGGGTHFPKLDMTIKPKKGNAAFWMNMENGKVDPRTLHAGQSVRKPDSVKYGMNIWFRDRAQT